MNFCTICFGKILRNLGHFETSETSHIEYHKSIKIALVSCGDKAVNDTLVVIKSAILFSSMPIEFFIVYENGSDQNYIKQVAPDFAF